MCVVDVRGQPCSHGLLGEGRRTGHPEPSRGPERGKGGRASLEGEERSRPAKVDHSLCNIDALIGETSLAKVHSLMGATLRSASRGR